MRWLTKSRRTLRCCFHDAKSRFFRAFTAIFSKTGRFASKPVVLSLLRSKCMPILLLLLRRVHYWLVKPCHWVYIKYFPLTFSDWFVKSGKVSFFFIPVKSQILIRTASFLQKFTVSENSLCMLFTNDVRRQLGPYVIFFIQFGDNIQTARQLRNAVFAKFFVSHSCC